MVAENPLARWAVETIDGHTIYRIAARTAGQPVHDRPPVLLLNGCAIPAGGWSPVIEGLPGHNVLALDRPGFAGTPFGGGVPDLAGETALLQQVLTRHGATRLTAPSTAARSMTVRAVIVAHSMAAFRAEALARLRPELVAGIVLVDPSVEFDRVRGLADRLFGGSQLRSVRTLLSSRKIRSISASIAHRGFVRETVSGTVLDEGVFKDPYADPETLTSAFAEWLSYRSQAADLTALRASTGEVRVPTSALFASGLPGQRRLRALEAGLTRLETRVVSGSAHLMMIDRPDEIIRAVEENAAR